MLEHYAPRLLITQLIDRKSGNDASCTPLVGVVLFVDIVNSTGLTDDFARQGSNGAEHLAALLNRYFGRVIGIIAAHDGDTIRIDGDAVIALWHLRAVSDTRHQLAVLAATAATALRREFDDWQPVAGLTLRHRITLVSGDVQFILLSESGGRRFFVLAGEPIRQLGEERFRGDPDQVIVSGAVAELLGKVATLAHARCGQFELLALSRDETPPERTRVGQQTPATDVAGVTELVQPFVPPVVVDRVAAGQADWLAEFRKLSVVYVNLVGLDTAAPGVAQCVEGAVRKIEMALRPLGVAISNVVASEKGFLVQIACGLPPFAQERNAALAVEAALRIHSVLASTGIAAAIGVTTGHAFCGDVGSEYRREYMSTGPVMGYAARLMQIAVDEILCDEVTARAAAGHADFSDIEWVEVRGRTEPLPVRRVRDRGDPVSRVGTGIGVMFGRQDELQLLTEWLGRLCQDGSQIAAIEAEPGGGKTHLLAHVFDAARTLGCQVLTTATSQIEKATAYFAFREILRQLLRRPEDAADPPVSLLRTRLAEVVRGHPLAAKAALLEDILPLELADRGLAPDIKGPARIAGIEDLVVHIAQMRAAVSPVVILLDDVHWIDASSANLLASMLRRVRRLLAVLATRPGDGSDSAYVRLLLDAASPVVRLPRLRREAIQAIVGERLSVAAVPIQLVDFIQARSEGLPFFAEQLLFALREQGVVAIEDGRCRVAVADLSKVGAPDSVRDLIVSRLDRLAPSGQLTIKVASAAGRVFEADLLRHIHPMISDSASLAEGLDQLIEAGFLSHGVEADRGTYAFRHGIIQGVTYDLLTYAQRRPLHKSIAEYLESKYQGALTPHYATLADHWERAADADRAISYRIDAAEIAADRYANEDALNHLDFVDRLVSEFHVSLPTAALTRYTRIRADSCQELTRFGEANGYYRTLAGLHGIPVLRTRAQLIAGIAREATVQVLHRLGLVRTVSRGAEQQRAGLAAHIQMRFAENAYFTNDSLGVAHGTLASLNRAERARMLPEIVNASGGLAIGLATVGMLPWARYYRDRSIELATTAGSPSSQGFAELLACVQSFHAGDWDRMGVHGVRGALIWNTLGDRYRYQCCLVLEGYRLIAIGHYREADQALAGFGEQADDIDSAQVRAWALAARALVDLLLGRPPALALARIATATFDDSLHPAERLLCGGIAAAARLEAADFQGALREAEAGLASLLNGSPAMAGALLFSVPCIAEVLLALADRAASVDRTREDLLVRAKLACVAARRVAARNRICRPRVAMLRGRLAASLGQSRKSRACYLEAVVDARRLGLPFEQAMCHVALSAMSGAAADRDEHQQRAARILRRLGVVWAPWRHFRDSATWQMVGIGNDRT